ncbi:MAG: MFS family permease [Verrucomicrobiales bacterium]|jgi:MFS family permease
MLMSSQSDADSTRSQPAITSPLLKMWALFLGVLLMMLGNGLQGTLVGVRSTNEDFATGVIGVILAAYYAGFLLGSRFTIRALGKVGHVRVFAALASLASTAFLIHSILVNPPTWLLMRFVTGFCMAGLYVVTESWLNDQTTPETRGRTLSLYMVVTMGGVTGGQFLLNVADPNSFELFIIASVLVSMSLVPMALSEASAPAIPQQATLPFRDLLRIVPTGVVTMFFSGAAAGSLFAFGPVYASRIGMNNAQISLFLSAALVGSLVFQLPIGALSDKISRRAVMAGCALIATVASIVGLGTGTGFGATAALFAIGATSFPLYSLAIAYTNDWIEDHQRVGAAGLLVMINGVGAILGPLFAALLMSLFEPSAYFWSLIITHGAIFLYFLVRIVIRDALPVDEQSTYRPYPARSSAIATSIGHRIPKPKVPKPARGRRHPDD